jgi:ribosomal protein S18 acetylase RimI-like enzyme
MSPAESPAAIRALGAGDLAGVARIDAAHTGRAKRAHWKKVFDDVLGRGRRGELRVGLAAERGGRLCGYLLGEVRAFEFGSEPCGWVLAVGVEGKELRRGTASLLLTEACRRFRDAGIERVRTMVRRNDVDVTAFFRSNGFAGGSFVQLEVDLGKVS